MQQNSLLDMQPGGGSFLLSDPSTTNRDRASLHIYEEDDKSDNDYGYSKANMVNFPTTPTLQQIGSDAPESKVTLDNISNEEYQPQMMQIKHASQSAIIQASKLRATQVQAYDNVTNTIITGAIEPPYIIDQRQRGIGVYQPNSSHVSSVVSTAAQGGVGANFQPQANNPNNNNSSFQQQQPQGLIRSQSAAYGNPQTVLQSRNKIVGQIGRVKEVCMSSELQMQSMSSFVPSAHLLSTSVDGGHDMRRITQQRNSLSAASGDFNQQQYQQRDHSGGQDGGAELNDTMASRRNNLNLLDQNFSQLMEQNSRLEREIRDMNAQFTQKQNERLAMAQSQLDAHHIAQASATPSRSENTNTQPSAMKVSDLQQRPEDFVLQQMQSSFDDRCQRTKQIVSTLASRLHEVKRDTSTELDKLQTRQSCSKQSRGISTENSNSRSPRPNKAVAVSQPAMDTAKHSHKNSQGFFAPHEQHSHVSLRKLNPQEHTDLSNQRQREMVRFNQGNGDNMMLVDDVMYDVSAVQTHQTNTQNVSVNSTANNLNFRQLKPQESCHTSLNELQTSGKSPTSDCKRTMNFGGNPVEQNFAPNDRVDTQEQLCFESSPIRKSQQESCNAFSQRQQEQLLQTKTTNFNNQSQNRSQLNTQGALILQGNSGTDEQKAFNESLMQMIPSANAAEQTSDSQGQQTTSQQQQSFKSTQQKQLDQIRLQSEQLKMSIKNPDTMVSTNEQNLAAILDQNNQTLGPDRSPLNVNGAAQLSNILQQINNNNANSQHQGNGRNNDQPLQHIAQATEHTTLSPSNLLNQKQTAFFLSQDNQNTTGINHVEQVQQSQAEAHNITQPTPRAVGLNQQIDTMMCDKQSHHQQVSQLAKKEQVLNVLRQNLAEQELNQDNLSRQLDNNTTNTLQERTHTSDGMTNATFDRMHMDIMKLQDKIKFLESQMVTSPSARNTIQANEEQKSTIRDGIQDSIKVTLESNMSAPYKHDSKHMKDSSKLSILKMTVPKTVTVQPFAENSGYHQSELVASSRCYQQDDKSLAHTSTHKHVNSLPIADQCMAAENHVSNNDARRFKSRSVVEPSLFKISEKQTKHSARNLHNELTYRERDEKSGTPLQRDIGELMSQSQPELVKLRKGRRDSSIKTISRIGSRRSSKTKSPKSRSQKSKNRKQGSSRADQKSLLKHSKNRKSSCSQIISQQQALSRRSREKHGSTMAAEPFADLSQNPILGVSFREMNEDLDETAQARHKEIISKEQTQMTDAYIITNSEYTGTSQLTSTRDQANKGQLIMSQIMSPKVIASNELIHSGRQPSSPGQQYNDQQPSLVEELSQDEGQAMSSSAQTLSQSRKQQKQTFPLRVRKNQTFAKGPDCVSVPSSITQAAEKFIVDSQDLSDEQINTLRVQDQRSFISGGHPDHSSSSDQPPNTIQEDILRDYEIQISANKHPSQQVTTNPGAHQQNSRNHMQQINSSEIEQVQNAVSSYLFDPLQIDQLAQEEKAQNGNGTNFSNQTSRFEQQPNSKKQSVQNNNQALFSIERQTDENPLSAYRDTSDRQKARSSLKRVDSDRSEGPDVKVNFSNAVDDYSGDESTDDNMRCMEQRPFSPPEKKKSGRSNHADLKVCNSRDLPLQRQSHSRDGSAAKVRATEKSRIAFLEQRNKHLELELKRHQVHLAKSDELHQKYRCLKLDYKQLLQSFERSEEIRREQKELINEQRQQLKNLKVQVKQQEGTIGELVRDTEQLKAVNMNNLSSMFDQSRVQTENQTRALRNGSGNNTHSYQMPPNQAYNSGSERSRDTSRSQQSVSQMSRSQLQMTGQSYNMAQSASNYGMMTNGQNAADKMPLQYTKPTILQSYAALNGHGMLDFPPNMGTDLLPDGYSCMEEGNSQQQIVSDQYGRLRDRRTVKRGSKRQHRSRSETSEKSSRKRKKSHKKKHHKRRHNDHSRPKKVKRDGIDEYSRSLSEHRSRSNKSQPRKRKQSTVLNNNYLVEDPNSCFLQSAQSSARPPRDSRKCSATKRRSRSRKSKKVGKEAGYIFNIQTNPSDIIKGVHRFQSTAKSSFDQQTSRRSSSARKSGKQKYQTTTTHFRP